MLKVEYTEVMNIEGALRGARNPLKSHHKSDSFQCDGVGCYYNECPCYYCESSEEGTYEACHLNELSDYVIGENDMQLARTLVRAGSSHRKFIRQIFVSVDITAPLYWWKQFDQYKIGVVTNSESTMHCIHKKEFELDDFSHEHLSEYNESMIKEVICALNRSREYYVAFKEKLYWDQMIQLLPNSYNQKRTVTFDYENLRNMYHERKGHKLDEWHTFCEWIESLPYSELITMEGR